MQDSATGHYCKYKKPCMGDFSRLALLLVTDNKKQCLLYNQGPNNVVTHGGHQRLKYRCYSFLIFCHTRAHTLQISTVTLLTWKKKAFDIALETICISNNLCFFWKLETILIRNTCLGLVTIITVKCSINKMFNRMLMFRRWDTHRILWAFYSYTLLSNCQYFCLILHSVMNCE